MPNAPLQFDLLALAQPGRIATTQLPRCPNRQRHTRFDASNPTGYAQTIEEITDGSVTKSYTIGLDVISQAINDSGLTGTLQTYLYDGHGSVRQLADAVGKVVKAALDSIGGAEVLKLDYDAYGQAINFAAATVVSSLLYSGEFTDATTGQQYLRARFYDPATGRFNRVDPFAGIVSEPQSLHKYLYGHGDPVTLSDPSGLSAVATVGLGVSIVGLAIATIGIGLLISGLQNNNALYVNTGIEIATIGLGITAAGIAVIAAGARSLQGAGVALGVGSLAIILAIINTQATSFLTGTISPAAAFGRFFHGLAQTDGRYARISSAGDATLPLTGYVVFASELQWRQQEIDGLDRGLVSGTAPGLVAGNTVLEYKAVQTSAASNSYDITLNIYKVNSNGTLSAPTATTSVRNFDDPWGLFGSNNTSLYFDIR